MELAPSRSKQVDDVEKPGNPVIADRKPVRVAAVQAMAEGGDEPLQQPPMPAEATLRWIGDDKGECRRGSLVPVAGSHRHLVTPLLSCLIGGFSPRQRDRLRSLPSTSVSSHRLVAPQLPSIP